MPENMHETCRTKICPIYVLSFDIFLHHIYKLKCPKLGTKQYDLWSHQCYKITADAQSVYTSCPTKVVRLNSSAD
jgi:hypothetical protein